LASVLQPRVGQIEAPAAVVVRLDGHALADDRAALLELARQLAVDTELEGKQFVRTSQTETETETVRERERECVCVCVSIVSPLSMIRAWLMGGREGATGLVCRDACVSTGDAAATGPDRRSLGGNPERV
jgi:hypothetical protein